MRKHLVAHWTGRGPCPLPAAEAEGTGGLAASNLQQADAGVARRRASGLGLCEQLLRPRPAILVESGGLAINALAPRLARGDACEVLRSIAGDRDALAPPMPQARLATDVLSRCGQVRVPKVGAVENELIHRAVHTLRPLLVLLCTGEPFRATLEGRGVALHHCCLCCCSCGSAAQARSAEDDGAKSGTAHHPEICLGAGADKLAQPQ